MDVGLYNETLVLELKLKKNKTMPMPTLLETTL